MQWLACWKCAFATRSRVLAGHCGSPELNWPVFQVFGSVISRMPTVIIHTDTLSYMLSLANDVITKHSLSRHAYICSLWAFNSFQPAMAPAFLPQLLNFVALKVRWGIELFQEEAEKTQRFSKQVCYGTIVTPGILVFIHWYNYVLIMLVP